MMGLAVFCPGQGNQHPAMFDHLLGNERAEAVLQEAAQMMGEHPAALAQRLPEEELFANALAQPLIAAAELATWAALREFLPIPRVMAGYSAGELPAYGCAGALETRETLELAARRAALMDRCRRQPGGMIALRGIGAPRAQDICRTFGLEIAIVNGPDHFVLGGEAADVARLEAQAGGLAIPKVRRLAVTVPSHTSSLSGAVSEFFAALSSSALKSPPVPVLGGISGEVVRHRQRGIETLARQIAGTVQWSTCMQTAFEMGCRVFLEIGPGNALSQMLRESIPELKVRAVEEFRTLQGVISWVERNCD